MSCIRLATLADAPAIEAIYRPIVAHTFISFELEPPSVTEIEARLQKTLPSYPWLVYEEDGIVWGYAYASPHRSRAAYQWSADVSAYVHEQGRRRGIARQLYTKMFDLTRQQGIINLYAGIALPNVASVGFHEAVGFEPLGVYRRVGHKMGAWRDVGWWSLALQPNPPATPKPIIPFAQLDAGANF